MWWKFVNDYEIIAKEQIRLFGYGLFFFSMKETEQADRISRLAQISTFDFTGTQNVGSPTEHNYV